LQWQLILQHYDVPQPATLTPVGGTASPNLRVDVSWGSFILRRRPPAMAEPDFIRFDHALRSHLADRGFPAPRPVPTRTGDTWVVVEGETYELAPLLPGTMVPVPDIDMLLNVGKRLAVFHRLAGAFHHPGKDRFVREDHPSILIPLVEELAGTTKSPRERDEFTRIGGEIDALAGLWTARPITTILHGDFHPGNVLFDANRVSALLDYDYAAPGPTTRDLGDALVFFAARRNSPFDPNDIRSLTQVWHMDDDRARALLRGYASVRPLPTDLEILRDLMRSRWLQVKLRGSRKVPREQKADFVLTDLWPPIDWLKTQSVPWFQRLIKSL